MYKDETKKKEEGIKRLSKKMPCLGKRNRFKVDSRSGVKILISNKRDFKGSTKFNRNLMRIA